jgi:hypothetical protein
MASVYGQQYELDENITQKRLAFGKVKMVETADTTSGTNAARTVFEQRAKNSWCVVLSSPPVAQIVPYASSNRLNRPSKWEALTQSDPGFDRVKIVYLWRAAKAVYFPTTCFYVSKTMTRAFDCQKAY